MARLAGTFPGRRFKELHAEPTARYGEMGRLTEVQEFIALAAERRVREGQGGRFR